MVKMIADFKELCFLALSAVFTVGIQKIIEVPDYVCIYYHGTALLLSVTMAVQN